MSNPFKKFLYIESPEIMVGKHCDKKNNGPGRFFFYSFKFIYPYKQRELP